MSKVLTTCAVVFAVLDMVPGSWGAEYEVHPSIAVSAEYTDNLFETTTNRTSDYITRLMPGLAARYKAPALNGDLAYLFDYRHYDSRKRGDEITHSLNANGQLVAGGFMHLDVNEEYQRVSLDVTRDVTRESLFVNQSDRNVVTASPYFRLRPAERISVKPGYRFIDTRYHSSGGFDKTDHVAFLETAYELTERWSLTADYTFTRELSVIDNFSQHKALGGFRYEYADKSFVFAQAGNSWTGYDSGHHITSVIWNAGLTHVFDTVTATTTTGVKYDEDPLGNIVKESFVSGILEKRFQRGTLGISPYYSEYAQTETDVSQTKKYGAIAQGRYDIFQKLNGSLSLTAEKFDRRLLSSYTRRIQVDSGLSYLMADRLTVSLFYIYVEYYSPGIATDNRYVNRGIIEIKKIF